MHAVRDVASAFNDGYAEGMTMTSTAQAVLEATAVNDVSEDILARLRRSFDDGLAGHAVAMHDGRIVACNAEFARIAGFASVDEAMAGNLHGLEPQPGGFAQLMERLRKSPLIPLEELNFIRRDGTPAHVLARLAATVTAHGDITEVRVYLMDITQRFALEQQLRESAERLSFVELATHDVLWDWNLVSGHLTWNSAVARRFRYTPDEVRSTTDWHMERIHPDDRERVLRSIERATLGVDNAWSDEFRFARGDGTYATVLDRAHIVRNGRGEPVRMVGVLLDITELRASEESQRFLASASAALESALDVNASAATLARLTVPALADVCVVDLIDAGGVLHRSAAVHADPARERHLGLGAELPDPCTDQVPTDGAPCSPVEVIEDIGNEQLAALKIGADAGLKALIMIPIEARERRFGVVSFGFTNGRRRFGPLEFMTAKDLVRRAGFAIDNATLYSTAQQAVRARNDVLGVVSHDLRVPVNTMMATLELLGDNLTDRRDEVHKWFDMLCRATRQMNALIQDLLDASRMESEHFTLHRNAGSISDIIAEACEMLRPIADVKSIRIEADVPEKLPAVSVDTPKLVRVLGNLLGNAVKFSPDHALIRVAAVDRDHEVHISVTDQGDGIAEDQLPFVFDRFWSGRVNDRRGAGLGLTIAKGIIEAHGGRIWVESEKNLGSTFTFAVPTGAAASASRDTAEEAIQQS
jgi:PAS domain S-box-containing protein